jgi:2'-5' RNA ligase
MALIRSFIAIELPEGLKKELTELEATLKTRSPSVVKWVDPNSIHITLKFLGDVPEEKIDEILMAIEESATGVIPFKLEVRNAGAFPDMNRVQVVWVGVTGEMSKLTRLQTQIESNMEQLDFPRDKRAFSPHLTLGRVRDYASPEERQKIGKLLAGTTFTPVHPIAVESICLIKSQLTPTGSIYTKLGEVKLKSGS